MPGAPHGVLCDEWDAANVPSPAISRPTFFHHKLYVPLSQTSNPPCATMKDSLAKFEVRPSPEAAFEAAPAPICYWFFDNCIWRNERM